MPKAIFVVGFNNWGKSKHIQMLFSRKRFAHGPHRPLDQKINASFLVESRSNDDVGQEQYIQNIDDRYRKSGLRDMDLIAALCPSRELQNDAFSIFQSPEFRRFNELHVLLLQYKWDWHAELRLTEVRAHLRRDSRVRLSVINADANFTSDSDRLRARDGAIRAYLQRLYP